MSVEVDEKKYLGDQVYASFDGHQIWLQTDEGGSQRIAITPLTFLKLVEFRLSIVETQNKSTEGGKQ